MEAEGRALRYSVMQTAIVMGCMAVVVVFDLVGLGFFLWAGYQYLVLLEGPIIASLICGVVFIFFAVILAWLAKRLIR